MNRLRCLLAENNLTQTPELIKVEDILVITTRHVVREGNVFTRVCLSFCPTGGGDPM